MVFRHLNRFLIQRNIDYFNICFITLTVLIIKNMKKAFIIITFVLASLVGWSCKDKFLDIAPPTNQQTDAVMFQTKEQFDGFIIGAYAEMLGIADWVQNTGFVSQDVLDVGEQRKALPTYMVPTNGAFQGYWQSMYIINSRANILIERIKAAPSVITAAEKTRIEGEAKFLRGFAYFHIARAYGNAPLILETFSTAQTVLPCTPEDKLWDQVILDMKDASDKLPKRAEWGNANLGRATKGSALAFLANAYMYKKDWANAAKASQDLIAMNDYQLLGNVREVFSTKGENGKESIFEVQFRAGNFEWSNNKQTGSLIGAFTAPRNIGGDYAHFGAWGEMVLDKSVRASMEPGDDRRQLIKGLGDKYKGEAMSDTIVIGDTATKPAGLAKQAFIPQRNVEWSVKYWYGKGPDVSGSNIPVMRYAEFALNYAEALFEQGKTAEAYAQLNAVRNRAKLPNKLVSADKEVFMTALMNERRWELNTEPNLWFHYTRTGRSAAFMTAKGVNFDPKWNKFPIPQSERDQNPNLCQNNG